LPALCHDVVQRCRNTPRGVELLHQPATLLHAGGTMLHARHRVMGRHSWGLGWQLRWLGVGWPALPVAGCPPASVCW
jgi:hypothetical protein